MHRHRAGISLGLVITLLGGGVVGYLIGANAPTGTVFNMQHPGAEFAGAGAVAAIGAAFWAIGELITGLTRAVERDAILVRLGISLFGSFASVVTATLHQLGIQTTQVGGVGTLIPLAAGLGSVALGAHALLHQIRLLHGAV